MLHSITPGNIATAMSPLYNYQACALEPDKNSPNKNTTKPPVTKSWFTLPPGYQPRLYTNVSEAPHSLQTLEDIPPLFLLDTPQSSLLDTVQAFIAEQWDYLHAAHAGLQRIHYMPSVINPLHTILHDLIFHPRKKGLQAPLHEPTLPNTPVRQVSTAERYMLAWQVSFIGGLLEILKIKLQSKPAKIDLTTIALHCLCFTGPYRCDWRTCSIDEIYADGDLAWKSLNETMDCLSSLDLLLPYMEMRDSPRYAKLYTDMHYLLGISSFNSRFGTMLGPFISHSWRGLSSIIASFCVVYAPHLEHTVRMCNIHRSGSRTVPWRCANRFVPLTSNNPDFSRVPVSSKKPGFFIYDASDNVPKHFPRQLVGIVLNKFSHAIVPSFFVRDFCDSAYLLVPSTKRVFNGLMRLYNVPPHDPLVTEDLTTQALLSTWNDDFPYAASELFGLQYSGKVHLRHFIDETETEPIMDITTNEAADETDSIIDDEIFHAIYMKHNSITLIDSFIKADIQTEE